MHDVFAGFAIHFATQHTLGMARTLGKKIVAQAEGTRMTAYIWNGNVYIYSVEEIPQPQSFAIPDEQLHRPGQTTSEAALKKSARTRTDRQRRVYEKLADFGRAGAIPEKVAEIMREDLIDVRRCFSVLKKLDLIEPTGEQRENPKGNLCELMRVKEK